MDPIQQYAARGALEAAFKGINKKPGIQEAGKEFGKILEDVLGNANSMQVKAGQAVDGLITGEVKDIHQVMVAVNKAELSFKFLVEVRNKLVEAYTELMSSGR